MRLQIAIGLTLLTLCPTHALARPLSQAAIEWWKIRSMANAVTENCNGMQANNPLIMRMIGDTDVNPFASIHEAYIFTEFARTEAERVVREMGTTAFCRGVWILYGPSGTLLKNVIISK